MSDEMTDSEMFKAIREHKQQCGEANRADAVTNTLEAKVLAEQYGMILLNHSEVHYSLRGSHCGQPWIINIYPGNRRICKTGIALYLRLPKEWSLVDVVRATADATMKISGSEDSQRQLRSQIRNRERFD